MARIKRKDGENLSKGKIQEVIKALEADKPITKVVACSMLNIAYNTTRLGNIIEEYKEKEANARARRRELRGKGVEKSDVKFITEAYLAGESLDYIMEVTFRSSSVIKKVLEDFNVPLRSAEHSYSNPIFLDPGAIKKDYSIGDLVYSAIYNKPATIAAKFADGIYRILFHGEYRKSAYQAYYELADLTDLQEYGDIILDDIDTGEVNRLILEARKKARSTKNGRKDN